MKRGFKAVVTLLGIMLTVYGLWYFLKSNFNIGSLLLIFAGILITGWFFMPENGFIRALKVVILAGAAVYMGLALFIFVCGSAGGADYSEDAVVVLGCGVNGTRLSLDLKARLDRAVEYYENNPHCVICVSGGQGPQEDITEASAMREYLISKSVPEEKILIEDRASSTEENFRLSKQILDAYFGGDDYAAAYITNDFHSYRSGLIARRAGFKEIYPYPSKTTIYSIIPNYMREVLAVLKTWILG